MVRGIISVIIASVLFGITPLGNKYVLLSGMSEECVLVWQAFVQIVGTGLCRLFSAQKSRIPGKDILRLLLIGGAFLGGTDYLLNSAYGYLPVSIVIMLHFIYPVIVLLISVLFLHKKLSKVMLLTMGLSLLGLVLITDFAGGITLKGVLFALGSALAYALFIVTSDTESIRQYSLLQKLYYFSWGAFIVYGIKILLSGSFSMPADGKTAIILIGVVGIGSLLGFYFITAGVRRIGAGKTALLNMLEPITGVIGGVLVYHEVIGMRGAAGCVCVILAVLAFSLESVKTSR
ncbi:MAG: DMT family transporter [Oscillospiraceae bacterium]|nr:DMT family transporter [Lachnospiraceae bacterium]MBQ6427977.1 DMT family transporter [Oscillospiraceae bacterium]